MRFSLRSFTNKVKRYLSWKLPICSGYGFVNYGNNRLTNESKFIDNLARVSKEGRTVIMSFQALANLASLTMETNEIPGDIAEVGVFQGGSAKLIAMYKNKDRNLHLFDTFEGRPPSHSEFDEAVASFKTVSLPDVKEYLSGLHNIHFYKGRFPKTGEAINTYQFSFVHLDVDLYESTLDALDFFYPRMVKGAIILSHDYNYNLGVRQAFNKFFTNKDERPIELQGTSQCMVIKLQDPKK